MKLRTLTVSICCAIAIALTSCEKQTITPENSPSSDLQLRKSGLADYSYDASSVDKILEEAGYSNADLHREDREIWVVEGVFDRYDPETDRIYCHPIRNTHCAIGIFEDAERNNSDIILVDETNPVILKNAIITNRTYFDRYSVHQVEQL